MDIITKLEQEVLEKVREAYRAEYGWEPPADDNILMAHAAELYWKPEIKKALLTNQCFDLERTVYYVLSQLGGEDLIAAGDTEGFYTLLYEASQNLPFLTSIYRFDWDSYEWPFDHVMAENGRVLHEVNEILDLYFGPVDDWSDLDFDYGPAWDWNHGDYLAEHKLATVA